MSSPRTRSSMAMPRRAPHYLLYPITTSLGITGTKAQKRREVNARLRTQLAIHSSIPPPSAILPSNHQGHDLSGPLLNTTIEPGGYRQVCLGCPQSPCPPANRSARKRGAKYKPKVFIIGRGLPPHILKSGMLGRLARARVELRPVPRGTTTAAPAIVSPSASTSALPPSSPPPPSSRATTLEAELPDAAMPVADMATPELAVAPATPPTDRLRFHFGGYGGVYYSPDGYIVGHPASAHTSSNILRDDDIAMDADDDVANLPALEYPSDSDSDSDSEGAVEIVESIPAAIAQQDKDKRPFDIDLPVALIAWHDNNMNPISTWAHPRVLDNPGRLVRRGELVLNDYRATLIKSGFPVQPRIERYFDGLDRWMSVPWTHRIQVFPSLNRTIYLRNPGLSVNPPSHVLEL